MRTKKCFVFRLIFKTNTLQYKLNYERLGKSINLSGIDIVGSNGIERFVSEKFWSLTCSHLQHQWKLAQSETPHLETVRCLV